MTNCQIISVALAVRGDGAFIARLGALSLALTFA